MNKKKNILIGDIINLNKKISENNLTNNEIIIPVLNDMT